MEVHSYIGVLFQYYMCSITQSKRLGATIAMGTMPPSSQPDTLAAELGGGKWKIHVTFELLPID